MLCHAGAKSSSSVKHVNVEETAVTTIKMKQEAMRVADAIKRFGNNARHVATSKYVKRHFLYDERLP